jgi:hypothetical protein
MIITLPSIPMSFAIDFVAKEVSVMGITLGKTITIFGITINPIVLGIILGIVVVGVILSWIFRKQIINFLKKALKFITGIDFDIE